MPRPRKPTKILQLQGTIRPVRHSDRRDVEMPNEVPGAPEWLTAEAREEWARLVSNSQYQRVLASVDRGMLAGYCTMWGEFERYCKEGMEYPTARLLAMLSMGAKLGLNPSDRAKLKMPEAPKSKTAFAALKMEA